MENVRFHAERAALRYADLEMGRPTCRVVGFLYDPEVTNVSMLLLEDAEESFALLVNGSEVLTELDASDFTRNGGVRFTKAVWGGVEGGAR